MIMARTLRYILPLATAALLTAANTARVIQTNSAGAWVHGIDPAPNKGVGVIDGIDVPDGRFAVSGSVAKSVISVIDAETDKVVWSLKLSSGIRPMVFTRNPDGSTKEIVVQLSDVHGLVVVDFAARKEMKRIMLPDVPG